MTEVDKLLNEVASWCEATDRTPSELGAIVLNHPGFVPLLRRRGTLRPETAARLRAFMAAFPTARLLTEAVADDLKVKARAGRPWEPGPPPEKPRIRAEVIRAAKLDGRDLPTFVTALIDMGLECWRDDRLLSGEAVA